MVTIDEKQRITFSDNFQIKLVDFGLAEGIFSFIFLLTHHTANTYTQYLRIKISMEIFVFYHVNMLVKHYINHQKSIIKKIYLMLELLIVGV